MHAAGVRCSDCHDPHSLSLRREGNALCAGCHDPGRFDASAHHGHDPATEAGACVTCHMPDRVYMQVDARRDHSFPIPRPDRRESLGTPDACARCHPKEGAEWATRAIAGWRDPSRGRPPHWADSLVADGVVRTDPSRWLEIAIDPATPPLVRASAWARLADESESMPSPELVRDRLSGASALERLGLIELVERRAPALRVELLRPLLEDDRRAVRIAAAEALADVPAEHWRPADRSVLARGLAEYRQSQEANAERPEAQVNLAGLAIRYGDLEAARAAYLRALERAPYFVPAYVNLADLERAVGNEEAALLRLRQALEIVPEDARVRYALGLALHRMGRADEALAELQEAALRAPGDPRLVLAWSLSLDAAGRRSEAIGVLEEAVDRGVANGDLMHALVSLLREEGELERARGRARQWQTAAPGDVRARQMLESLGAEPR
jgi:predicted CXXCH cytochrome family protein